MSHISTSFEETFLPSGHSPIRFQGEDVIIRDFKDLWISLMVSTEDAIVYALADTLRQHPTFPKDCTEKLKACYVRTNAQFCRLAHLCYLSQPEEKSAITK